MNDDQRVRLKEEIRKLSLNSHIDGLRLVARMACETAEKMRSGEIPMTDGPAALDILVEICENVARRAASET